MKKCLEKKYHNIQGGRVCFHMCDHLGDYWMLCLSQEGVVAFTLIYVRLTCSQLEQFTCVLVMFIHFPTCDCEVRVYVCISSSSV